MKKSAKTTLMFTFTILLINLTLISSVSLQAIPSEDYFFKVRILSSSESETYSLANLLSQELRRIRIDSLVSTYPDSAFESAVLSKEFDLVFIGIEWPTLDVDSTNLFSQEGAANYWGLDDNMAAGQENEGYLKDGLLEINESLRIDIYHNWQENLIDNILPIIPLYNKVNSFISWDTLTGWDHEEGIIASLPYMEWSSPHYQQENTSVFIDYVSKWEILNPLYLEDNFLIQLVSEPLIRFDKTRTPYGVLAESWNFNTNQTKLTFNLRDDVKWQPDKDNLFDNENFTADDVIFSVQMYQNFSTIGTLFQWIVDYEKESDYVVHFYIDGDSNTPGLQPYAPALQEFTRLLIPEHYLNVSVGLDGLPDTSHENWEDFGVNGLGTGMYYFVEYLEGIESKFYRNNNWWGTSADAFNDDLDIAEYRIRFFDDLTAKKLEFENGKLDIFRDYQKNMVGYLIPPYQIQTRTEYDVTYLGFNLKSIYTPEIKDPTLTEDGTMSKGLAVRKAIAHMTSKDQITNLIEIESSIIESPLSNKFGPYVKTDIKLYDYNLDNAKQFMLKAGHNPDTKVTPNISIFGVFAILLLISTTTFVIRKNKK
ncbi:MAG: hypothetical protein FK730_04365 [Asgard group archaeon]|nr:hypothetical protein [Asgard group archaeon]